MAHRLLAVNAGPLRFYANGAGGATGAALEQGGDGSGSKSGSMGSGSVGGTTGIKGGAMPMGGGGAGVVGLVKSSSLPRIMSAEELAQEQQKFASSNLASSTSAASLASSAAGLARVWAARTPTRRLVPAHSVASMRMCAPRSFGGQAERFYETHGRTPFTPTW